MSYNGTRYTKYSEEDFAELEARRYDKTENPERPWTVIKNVGGVDQYMHYANFDWYNYLISNSRPTWDNNLSITGGTQKLNYFVSANYHTEDGIYKQNTDRFETANIRARISGDVKDWFNLTVTSHLYHSRYKAPGWTTVTTSRTTRSMPCHSLCPITPMVPMCSVPRLSRNNPPMAYTS